MEQEHGMFSSYVKAHYRYPDIVVSFLELSADHIHSCHFTLRAASTVRMTFVLLLTYTQSGVRLSCSEFEDLGWPDDSFRENIRCLVDEHLRVGCFHECEVLTLMKDKRTELEVENNCTVSRVYSAWRRPISPFG